MSGKRVLWKSSILLFCLWAGMLAVMGNSIALAEIPQTKLTAPDPTANDAFGYSVSVSGTTTVVGVPQDDDEGLGSGSAYVFIRDGSAWTQQQKLLVSNALGGAGFGWSVSVAGDTAIVSAAGDNIGGTASGSAYVFTRTGSTWSQQAKLKGSDTESFDNFGCSVSILGDTAVFGAPGDNNHTGSVYVFTRSGSTWFQQQKLTASNAATSDSFGCSVSISGDTVVIGAHRYGKGAPGSAYIFARAGSTWTQQAELTPSEYASSDAFGWSVSVSGDTAMVGAAYADVGTLAVAGSAYAFARSGSAWSEQAKLTASNAGAYDHFGSSVSVSGDTVIIGAIGNGAAKDSGSIYAFTRSGDTWTQQKELTASDAAAEDNFGWSVATDAGQAIVGAPKKDAPAINSGPAYVFDLGTLCAPEVLSFSINKGSSSTTNRTVTLNNTCKNTPTQYMASSSSGFDGATWQAYSTAPTFTITSLAYGTKTIHFKVKNEKGESAAVSDTITLDKATGAGSAWILFD